MNKHFIKVWGTPLALSILIVFGLLASLLGTGVWRPLSWSALAIPLLILFRKFRF